MELLQNHVPNPDGFYPYEAVVRPLAAPAGTVSGVFPQIFRGPTYTLCLHETAVYVVTDDTDTNWGQSAATVYGTVTEAAVTIPAGGVWHAALFYNGWMACNGACRLFQTDVAGGSKIYRDVSVFPLTVCELNGRLFEGGMARYYDRIQTLGYDNAGLFGASTADLDDSWVRWNCISGEDVLWPVYPDRMVDQYAGRFGTDILSAGGDITDGHWAAGAGWTAANPSVATGANTSLTYTTDELTPGNWYMLEMRVSDATSGSFIMSVTNTDDSIGLPRTLGVPGWHRTFFQADASGLAPVLTITGVNFTGEVESFRVVSVDMDRADHNNFLEVMERQQSGFSPTSSGGTSENTILCVKPLGNSVVAYGLDSIWAFEPVTSPIPTFAKARLADFGIMGRGAVCGSTSKHYFIDKIGQLWLLDGKLQLTHLGYQEFFELAIEDGGSSSVVMNYDGSRDNVYITLDTDGIGTIGMYMLTHSGLCYIATEYVTSLVEPRELGSVSHALMGAAADGASDEFKLQTVELSLGTSEVKTLFAIELLGQTVLDISVDVLYKASYKGNFATLHGLTPDYRGIISCHISFVSLKLLIRHVDYTAVKLDDIVLQVGNEKWTIKDFVTRM